MQKDMDITEQITYSTVLIYSYDQNNNRSSGTGFIMALCIDGDSCIPVIITNNHVVNGFVRSELVICKADENGNPIDTEDITLQINKTNWIQHPEDSVDLCCCSLMVVLHENGVDQNGVYYRPIPASLIPTEEELKSLLAIEDVYMVGYPKGLFDMYNHKPIVRKGITASHPNKDYQGKKETLLDIAIYRGSSGSPVLLLNPGSSVQTLFNLRTGPKVILLGVICGLHPDIEKEQQILKDPNNDSKTLLLLYDLELPFNLAIMIKAERILDFEKVLQDKFKLQETEEPAHG